MTATYNKASHDSQQAGGLVSLARAGRRYGSIRMKYVLLFIAMIPAFVQADVIC